ncbi:hypothetical protein RUND412_004077 [Rhizina undulata]
MSSSRSSIARPKRPSGLDAAVRSGAGLPESKRPKFDVRNPHELAPDAPDVETDVFLEVDEGAVGKRKGNRNAVEIEGYESDSSDEGFDETRKSWKKEDGKGKGKGKGKAKDVDDDDDDDMFADFRDEEDEVEKGRGSAADERRKKVKFMELDQIEGQDYESRREYVDIIDEDRGMGEGSDGDEDAQEEEDVDPEVGEGGRKKNAPKIDAFNMRNEMEEGRFDESGNFIRKAAEKDAVHDKWLEGVSRKDMRRAKEAMEKREAEQRERLKEDDKILTTEILAELITTLEKGETVLEALARLGKSTKKKPVKTSWREKKRAVAVAKIEMDVDTEHAGTKGKGKEVEDPAELRRKELVERITGAADKLLTRGQIEIYEDTREALVRQYRRESGEEWVDPKRAEDGNNGDGEDKASRQWEYRWIDGRDGGNVYGPYGNAEMASWNQHGFFGEGVEFKMVGGFDGWTKAAAFD